MKPLTLRQRHVLEFIIDSNTERGYPPTLREICEHLGTTSANGVSEHLVALETKGYIVREALKARGIRVLADPRVSDDLGGLAAKYGATT